MTPQSFLSMLMFTAVTLNGMQFVSAQGQALEQPQSLQQQEQTGQQFQENEPPQAQQLSDPPQTQSLNTQPLATLPKNAPTAALNENSGDGIFGQLASSSNADLRVQMIRYYVQDKLANYDVEGVKANTIVQKAWDSWVQAVEIPVKRATDLSDANILIDIGDTNSSGYALTDVGPPSVGRVYRLILDQSKTWTPLLMEQVVCHEIGHALGLQHTSTPKQLMNQFVQDGIKTPQSEDIQRAKAIWNSKPIAGTSNVTTAKDAGIQVLGQQQDHDLKLRQLNIESAQTLGKYVLVFAAIVLTLETCVMMLRRQFEEDTTFKLIGVTLIVIAGVFLTVTGVDKDLMNPMFGLLGALAGYILGRDASNSRVIMAEKTPQPPTT